MSQRTTPNPLPQLIPARIKHAILRLDSARWLKQIPLEVSVHAGEQELDARGGLSGLSGNWQPVKTGYSFGATVDRWKRVWFRLEVPSEDCAPHSRHLLWKCNGESTVHHNGSAIGGLDCAHPSCPLPEGPATLHIETCMWQTAIWADPAPFTSTGLRFEHALLGIRDERLHRLWVDLRVLDQWLETMLPKRGESNDWEGGRQHWVPPLHTAAPPLRFLLEKLGAALDAFDRDHLNACTERIAQIFAQTPGDGLHGNVRAIGHSHLDLVWRWPEGATRRKFVHTASNLADLLDRYSEFRCMLSQPWLLDRLEEDDPQLLRRLESYIANGRLELEGAMEVESDVLLCCGETLVRSLTTGQASFQKRTGEKAKTVWLPDVFGYAGCLPQLILLAGADSFFTSKLSWRKITRFPYSSFSWEGNDGSAVTAHVPPISFNSNAEIEVLQAAVEDHSQFGIHPEVLSPVGYGDGGGGPTADQVERIQRLNSFADVPETTWGSVKEFYRDLNALQTQLPRFRGELYLERHRGTATSQSDHKKAFREAEKALQAFEAVSARCGEPLRPELWERVILASFHDAIPGSSIGVVYKELNPQLRELTDRLADKSTELLQGNREDFYFNPCPYRLNCVFQHLEKGWLAVDLPPLGSGPAQAPPAADSGPVWNGQQLRNSRVCADFDAEGRLCGLQFGKQTVPLTGTPALWLHPDNPAQHDAWEVELHDLANGRTLDCGPLRQSCDDPLRVELTQDILLENRVAGQLVWGLSKDSESLDLRVEICWEKAHQWLRFEVPTGYAGRSARFGGPYGTALRPQWPGEEKDTSYWEGIGSRWAAVTDDACHAGLAMVTEAKFGFGAMQGTLSLSLLRAPTNPDPECDRGSHRMQFQLRPWRNLSEPDHPTPALAAELSYREPLPCGKELTGLFEWQDAASLVASWLCPSQSLPGAQVLRLHEVSGMSGEALLKLPANTEVLKTNLLEEALPEDHSLQWTEDGVLRIKYRAYEIITLRFAKA